MWRGLSKAQRDCRGPSHVTKYKNKYINLSLKRKNHTHLHTLYNNLLNSIHEQNYYKLLKVDITLDPCLPFPDSVGTGQDVPASNTTLGQRWANVRRDVGPTSFCDVGPTLKCPPAQHWPNIIVWRWANVKMSASPTLAQHHFVTLDQR